MTNKSIGGYFELETGKMLSSPHFMGIALNTARNALEYILLTKRAQKIFIPYFTCDVLLEPVKKLQIPFEFYNINRDLEPVFDFSVLRKDDIFLYTNYFGLKDKYILELTSNHTGVIIDNAQAFYAIPHDNVATFYSPRKFFGVADGAYLYCDVKIGKRLKKDISNNRMSHLLIRKDLSAEAGYNSFVMNDKLLENQSIKRMSSLTKAILSSVNYDDAAKKRIKNYVFLENILRESNQFTLNLEKGAVPMVYPYWSKDKYLRKRLLENKIYTATYWPNVKRWCEEKSLEYILTDEVVYLPIDQRYGLADMKKILQYV